MSKIKLIAGVGVASIVGLFTLGGVGVQNWQNDEALRKEYRDKIISQEFIVGAIVKEKKEYTGCDWVQTTTDVTNEINNGTIEIEGETLETSWLNILDNFGSVKVSARGKSGSGGKSGGGAKTTTTKAKTTTVPIAPVKKVIPTKTDLKSPSYRKSFISSPTKTRVFEQFGGRSNYYFIYLPNGNVSRVTNSCKDVKLTDYVVKINDGWKYPVFKQEIGVKTGEPKWYLEAIEGEVAYYNHNYEHIPKALDNFPSIPKGFKELHPDFYALIPDRSKLNGYKANMLLSCKPSTILDKAMEEKLNLANKELNLNDKKQVNLVVIICPEEVLKTMQYADQLLEGAIEESWKGSEKNQLIFLTFISKENTIKSIRTITWADGEDLINTKARELIGTNLDTNYIARLQQITKDNFVRTSFNKKYESIKKDLQTKYKIN